MHIISLNALYASFQLIHIVWKASGNIKKEEEYSEWTMASEIVAHIQQFSKCYFYSLSWILDDKICAEIPLCSYVRGVWYPQRIALSVDKHQTI